MEDLTAFAARAAVVSLAGATAEMLTFPIDTTKTKLQLKLDELRLKAAKSGRRIVRPPSAIGVVMSVIRKEGVRGLYAGVGPAVTRHVFYSPIRILIYEGVRSMLTPDGVDDDYSPPFASKLVAGLTAGLIGQFLVSPMDLIKVRMQADGAANASYRSLPHAVSKITRHVGFAGLWRGWQPNVQRGIVINASEMPIYDHAKHTLVHEYGWDADRPTTHFGASCFSGLVSSFCAAPIDLIKTRLMNQRAGVSAPKVYKGVMDCAVQTVKGEGVLSLWKGFLPAYARQGPWQVFFWLTYEQVRKMAGLHSF